MRRGELDHGAARGRQPPEALARRQAADRAGAVDHHGVTECDAALGHGRIVKIYPEIDGGRVLADVEVEGHATDVRVVDGVVDEIGHGLRPLGLDTEVVAGGGGALIPGLHDHHVHLLAMAAAADSIDLAVDTPHWVDRLRATSARNGAWIRLIGHHESRDGVLDRDGLDRLRADVPVKVQHRGGDARGGTPAPEQPREEHLQDGGELTQELPRRIRGLGGGVLEHDAQVIGQFARRKEQAGSFVGLTQVHHGGAPVAAVAVHMLEQVQRSATPAIEELDVVGLHLQRAAA